MTLWELSTLINDNTIVEIFAACNGNGIAVYDGKESIPDRYMDELVTDIFVSTNRLCVEIDIEPDGDYMEE